MNVDVDVTLLAGLLTALGLIIGVCAWLAEDVPTRVRVGVSVAVALAIATLCLMAARVSYLELRGCGATVPASSKLCD